MRPHALLTLWCSSLTFAQRHHALKAQLPILDLCAASPLLPDYQLACGKAPIWSPREASGNGTSTAAAATEQPTQDQEDIWRSDEGWHGPHSCAGVYCAYSRPSFANGRGIVLVSTARNAEEISQLPVFTEPPLNHDEDDGDDKAQGDSSALFRIVETPGKGLGVVASRPIKRGQRIMSHPPAVVLHRRFIDDADLESQQRLLDVAVNHLPEATRDEFLAQMAGQSGGSRVHDIIHTNSFELRLGIRDGHHVGNFPEVSRYNHDCRPNVAFYIDSDLRHYTHAVRDIAPGEELTISYLDSLSSRGVRQDRATRNWGFGCACAHCSLPAPLARASDDRLWRMWELEQDLSDWAGVVHLDEDAIELLVELYRQEALHQSHGSEAYRLAALNYNALGKGEKAVEYGGLALEQLLLEKGPRAKEVEDMTELLREPEKHWSWGKRM